LTQNFPYEATPRRKFITKANKPVNRIRNPTLRMGVSVIGPALLAYSFSATFYCIDRSAEQRFNSNTRNPAISSKEFEANNCFRLRKAVAAN
jgi:hypothetical protein